MSRYLSCCCGYLHLAYAKVDRSDFTIPNCTNPSHSLVTHYMYLKTSTSQVDYMNSFLFIFHDFVVADKFPVSQIMDKCTCGAMSLNIGVILYLGLYTRARPEVRHVRIFVFFCLVWHHPSRSTQFFLHDTLCVLVMHTHSLCVVSMSCLTYIVFYFIIMTFIVCT